MPTTISGDPAVGVLKTALYPIAGGAKHVLGASFSVAYRGQGRKTALLSHEYHPPQPELGNKKDPRRNIICCSFLSWHVSFALRFT